MIAELSSNGEFAKHPDKIFNAAVATMGEDVCFVLSRMQQFSHLEKICLDDLSLSEWSHLCRLLYLDINSIFYGYDRQVHLVRIEESLKAGTYRWRKTHEIFEAINALSRFEDNDWQLQLGHAGDSFHGRI